MRTLLLLLPLVACSLLLSAGCGKESPPPAVAVDQIAAGVPEAFKGAPAAVQTLVKEIVDAIGQQDFPTAWDKLQELNARPGLTDAQKEFVAGSIASVGAEVNKAESTGDEAAKQAIEFHRANK